MKRQAGSETDLVRACLQLLKMHGIFAYRNNSGALRDRTGRPVFYGCPGSSDITGILPNGIRLEIECKRPGNGLSPAQREFQERMRANKAAAFTVWSVDQLEKELSRIWPPRTPPG